jgi:IclR family transcriptional regulator, acetate operon repressor
MIRRSVLTMPWSSGSSAAINTAPAPPGQRSENGAAVHLDLCAGSCQHTGMRSTQRDAAARSVLERAFRILDSYGPADRTLTLAEMTRRTGIPKATVHRLAHELIDLGMLEGEHGVYRIGMRMFELGQLVPLQRELREAALPFMEDLFEATHETVHLAVLDGADVLYIEKISGHRRVAAGSRVGGRMPAHCTAVGKAILAVSPPDVLDAILAHGLVRRTAFTITAPGVLKRQLATAARVGVAYEREESDLGVTCAASPVHGFGHHVVAAISITGPVGRLQPERFTPTVRLAALGLSRRLGSPRADYAVARSRTAARLRRETLAKSSATT